MPVFIAFSLTLCFLIETASSLPDLLVAPLFIYIGLGFAVISILGAFFKKTSEKIWCDLFASATLLVWFAYWKPLFNDDSPLFFIFLLYFVFMSAFVALFFVGRQHKLDDESFRQMQLIAKSNIAQPWAIMLGVLVSLELLQHYLLYPVMMTLLMLRFALSSCLESR